MYEKKPMILEKEFPFVKSSEKSFAGFIGVDHCVPCANGTDTIGILLQAHKAIEIVRDIRITECIGLHGDYHPFAKKSITKHPFL